MERPNLLIMWITRTLVGVGLIIIACLLVGWLVATAPQAEVSSEPVAGRSVLVIEASPVQVKREFTGYGIARAIEDADVPARVSSTVLVLPSTSREGNRVSAKQVLVELDPTDFDEEVKMASQRLADIDAQLASLQVEEVAAVKTLDIAGKDLVLMQRELGRVQEAVAREAAMPREADQVQKQVLAAEQTILRAQESLDRIGTRRLALDAQRLREEAAGRIAQERVNRCTISSPIDGFIQSIDVTPGENLNEGARGARVVDPR